MEVISVTNPNSLLALIRGKVGLPAFIRENELVILYMSGAGALDIAALDNYVRQKVGHSLFELVNTIKIERLPTAVGYNILSQSRS